MLEHQFDCYSADINDIICMTYGYDICTISLSPLPHKHDHDIQNKISI